MVGQKKSAAGKTTLDEEKVLKILLEELPLKQAVDLATKILSARKNELYQRALEIKKS